MDDPKGRRATPIAVLPVGAVPEDELKLIHHILTEELQSPTLLLAPVKMLPAAAYDRTRRRYSADWLLEWLFDRIPPESVRVLAVVEADLFAKNSASVCGYAHIFDGVALYSPVRLREKLYGRNANRLKEHLRSRTAILHEVGHACGVVHCGDPACLMRQVKDLDELDAIGPGFCRPCEQTVDQALNIDVADVRTAYRRIDSLLRRNRYVDVLARCREAIGRFPADARLRYHQAAALAGLGDWKGAETSFSDAVRLDPAYESVRDRFEKYVNECKIYRDGI